ncbi:MAG: DegT/DnrJ/EryC1/StrS family aminotransferase [Bacteroides sp.]|uniref:hypothetical protein n=1 Tax=Bacteroides sp. TaxID=29523 RepID=UPI002FC841C1
MSIIGGEFDLDFDRLLGTQNTTFLGRGFLYSSGRAAFYHILLSIKEYMPKIKTLMLPDYICSSIINIALKSGFEIIYYPISNSLQINYSIFRTLYTKTSAVLLVNYFGLISLEEQVRFLREIDDDICIIEDNVQSFFSMYNDLKCDFSFTSFRKTFPVPDGSLVVTKHKLTLPFFDNTFAQYKIAGGVLKGLRSNNCFDDQLYLDLLEKGEEYIDINLESRMSDITSTLLSGIDLQRIALLRKRNAKYLTDGLSALGMEPLIPYKKEFVPLFIPIWLENRDNIRNFFFNNSIYCPVHWPVSNNTPKLLKGEELSKHELSLIIDQRYSLKDMDMILTLLEDSLHAHSISR